MRLSMQAAVTTLLSGLRQLVRASGSTNKMSGAALQLLSHTVRLVHVRLVQGVLHLAE